MWLLHRTSYLNIHRNELACTHKRISDTCEFRKIKDIEITYSLLTPSELDRGKRGSVSQSFVKSVPSAVAFEMIWKDRHYYRLVVNGAIMNLWWQQMSHDQRIQLWSNSTKSRKNEFLGFSRKNRQITQWEVYLVIYWLKKEMRRANCHPEVSEQVVVAY